MIGSEFGRYKIVERLGAGGMGEVYRAEDTTLSRPVALKFLAAHLLNDDEAKQRFLREARAAAAVRHPNICHLYEVGEENAKTFLAMDYLEGESLEERIAKGPLPLKDALDIGRQVAEGLEAAHEKGIVHRDIKPANVMVDAKGRATILDFGLARLTEASKLTRPDQTVGTAAYMSPEQMQGGEVDHRTDIWALGCVLYEMVAGLRPFKGQYDQALAYEVVHEEPEPLTGIRAGIPMELEILVAKCLEKDVRDRYQSVSEIGVDLRKLEERLKSSGKSRVLSAARSAGAAEGPLSRYRVIETLPAHGQSVVHRAEDAKSKEVVRVQVLPEAAAERKQKRELIRLAAVSLALVGLAALSLFLALGAPEAEDKPLVHFSYPVDNLRASPTISPDGRHIAYVDFYEGERCLWIRDLAQDASRRIEGTKGAELPFWSPDSRYVGFLSAKELFKLPVSGEPVTRICATPGLVSLGAAWSPGGESIVFSGGNYPYHALYEVSSQGGDPEQILPGNGAIPSQFVPTADRRRILLGVRGRAAEMLDLDSGEQTVLGSQMGIPLYSPTGHLLFTSRRSAGTLRAVPFSLEPLEPEGEAFVVEQDATGASVSNTGILVYLRTPAAVQSQLVWRGRDGMELGRAGQPQEEIWDPRLSPDQSRIAVAARDNGRDLWLHDASRPVKERFTFDDQRESLPRWSATGDRIAYSIGGGGNRIVSRRINRAGQDEELARSDGFMALQDWIAGEHIVYQDEAGTHRRSRKPNGEVESVTLLSGEQVRAADVSPDGRFLVYASDELGRSEIFVQRFPGGESKWLVSPNGGGQPRWSRDGTEIFYVEDDALMAAPVQADRDFSSGPPQRLFASPGLGRETFRDDSALAPQYDVSSDGRRFVIVEPAGDVESSIHVVQNWYEEFRDRQ